ncbi:MAG: DegV family protein [Ruminococcus sp.]|uniref:DegV family protein n=1 Tax=Ruminococcus sp. TaxID=41978 RepID=UPI0028735FE0|nr:DegV family protein [Ruminococcus sp.]MBQ3285650.1 DegV family protein [Ruminococcus sp.]
MSFTILTDTSANLPSSLLKEHDITVIPYHYYIGDKAYSCLNTEGFDGQKFYKAMRMGADIKTSAINYQSYIDFFEKFLDQGQDILFISMSSGISSSYSCAQVAKKELVEKYPDREILLVDTLGASLGEGIFVLMAAEYRDAGFSIQKVHKRLEKDKKRMYQVFTVDDLMYLKKTGRLTGSAAIIGNMLQVKPILKGNENGEIVNFAKVIGRKKAVDMLAQRYNMLVKNPEEQIVGIAHADCEEDAEYLIGLLNQKKPPREILTVMYEPVTGSHVGPGTLALFFLGDDKVRFR